MRKYQKGFIFLMVIFLQMACSSTHKNQVSTHMLKEGIYLIEKDIGESPENYAIVSGSVEVKTIGFKMYWSPNHQYEVFSKKNNDLFAKFLIDDQTKLFDTLSIKILSDTSFKVIDGTNNWAADTPYYFDLVYTRMK